MNDNILTQDKLKSILDYNPLTGEFKHVTRYKDGKSVNKRWGGKFAGCIHSSGLKKYIRINIHNLKYPQYAHRLAFLYMTGECPIGVDHIDGNGINNKWSNLRESSPSDNAKNVKRSSYNTSGVTGVSFDKGAKKWRAYIKINRKQIELGRFAKFDDAVAIRKENEKRLGFRDGHGSNRPLYN